MEVSASRIPACNVITKLHFLGCVDPSDADVLCGSGRDMQRHPGNVRFHQIISKYVPSYRSVTQKADKVEVLQFILKEVLSNGARVLKRHPVYSVWYAVADKHRVLRNKISNHLRCMLKHQNRSIRQVCVRELLRSSNVDDLRASDASLLISSQSNESPQRFDQHCPAKKASFSVHERQDLPFEGADVSCHDKALLDIINKLHLSIDTTDNMITTEQAIWTTTKAGLVTSTPTNSQKMQNHIPFKPEAVLPTQPLLLVSKNLSDGCLLSDLNDDSALNALLNKMMNSAIPLSNHD